MKISNKLSMLFFVLITASAFQAHAGTVVIYDIVGDIDQTHFAGTTQDGHSVIHESDDLAGFDMRMVGQTVNYSFDITGNPDFQKLVSIQSVKLTVATVGIIDGVGYWGSVIDDKLFVNGVEVPYAFDDSGYDGWELFTFYLDPSVITGGVLNVSLVADSAEGWGGIDYSEIEIMGEIYDELNTSVNVEPDTLNATSNGQYMTIYIFPPDGYLAEDIDPNTVKVHTGSMQDEFWSPERTNLVYYDEVNMALMAKLKRKTVSTYMIEGENTFQVVGKTYDGRSFNGSDTINVIQLP